MLHYYPQPVPTTSCRGTKGQSFPYRVCPQQVETWQMLQDPGPRLDRLRDPEPLPRFPAAWLTCHRATTPDERWVAPLPRDCERRFRRVLHPRFECLFRGLMSSGRRSDLTVYVISSVRRCHCGPERTLSESVHWFRPVEGRFTPVSATKTRFGPLCHQTQSRVQPLYCADAVRFGGAHRDAHVCGVLRGPCRSEQGLWASLVRPVVAAGGLA